MRRILTFNNVSVNGYFADAEGSLDQVVPDPELSESVLKDDEEIDTAHFGRVTNQPIEGFWPHVAKDPSTPSDLRAFADALTDMQRVVFSRTLKKVGWTNAKIFPKLVPSKFESMKRPQGGDMIVFGSGSIAEQLPALGLIDEYGFIVNPVLFGRGRPCSGTPR